jgi:hypothetical protein
MNTLCRVKLPIQRFDGAPTTTFYHPTTTFYHPTTTFYRPETTLYRPETTFYRPTTTFYRPTTTFYRPQLRSIAPKLRYTAPQLRSTATQLRSTAPKLRSTAPKIRSTVPHLRSTATQLRSTALKLRSTVPHLRSTATQLRSTAPQLRATAPKLRSTAPLPRFTVYVTSVANRYSRSSSDLLQNLSHRNSAQMKKCWIRLILFISQQVTTIKWIGLHSRCVKWLFHHHHHMPIKDLGHLLTRSGFTRLEVSSVVFLGSFCLLGNSILSVWVIFYVAFDLRVVYNFSYNPVFCLKLGLYLIPL